MCASARATAVEISVSEGRETPSLYSADMCGICGIYAFGDSFAVGEQLVTAMRDRMTHRGPDDGGSWTSPDGRLAFGHRRLSIVDLSRAGHQPMTNEDGTVWITYNGEVYNHAALRREPEARGH